MTLSIEDFVEATRSYSNNSERRVTEGPWYNFLSRLVVLHADKALQIEATSVSFNLVKLAKNFGDLHKKKKHERSEVH